MRFEKEDTSKDTIEDTSKEVFGVQYLRLEHFEGLGEVEIIPYSGEGNTSYASEGKGVNFDLAKKAYLERLGIILPEDWFDEESGTVKPEHRAMLVTTHIVTGEILTTESVRRTFGEDTKIFIQFLRGVNRKIEENRVDRYGYRTRLPSGELAEEHYRKMKLSANPTMKVREDELRWIVDFVVDSLKNPKVSE